MKYSEREKGKAGIIIELNNGNITVIHSATKEILKYFPSKSGGWDSLFDFLNKWEYRGTGKVTKIYNKYHYLGSHPLKGIDNPTT